MARHNNRRFSADFGIYVNVGKSFADLERPEVSRVLGLTVQSSPLPYRGISNELPGLRWEPPASDRFTIRLRYPLLKQAAEILSGAGR